MRIRLRILALALALFLAGGLVERVFRQPPLTQANKPFWTPGDRASHGDPALRKLLEHVAVHGEVLVAISNSGLVSSDGKTGMLADWVRRVRVAGVPNFLVFALDEHTRNAMIMTNTPVYLAKPQALALEGTHNHAASAQKFYILKSVVDLGFSVLLSDTDVVVLRNPFGAGGLVRDCDVEAQSDGFDDDTAYGRLDGDDDPAMGWSRYSQAWRMHAINSGLFYLRASPRTSSLLKNVHEHLTRRNDWDQSVFNLYVHRPLVDDDKYKDKTHPVTLRIMNIHAFVNSKTLFKHIRTDPARRNVKPFMVHVNYHPNKEERMKALEAHYTAGDSAAFDAFPVGSG